ncbi:kinase-like domain-containing protein, partial [Glomus cerebriforme]
NFSSLNWDQKYKIIRSITFGLSIIHDDNFIHKDLHLGNVLTSENIETNLTTYISDFGFCKPAVENSSKKIYGVMPYMTPEILRGNEYTKKSDIYSLGLL